MNIKTIFKGISTGIDIDIYPDAIIVINYDKDIKHWNKKASEIFGFTERETSGKNIGVFFIDNTDKIFKCLEENRSSAIVARTKSGQELYVEITCTRVPDEKEIIIAARDITKKQKTLEKFLIEYEKSSAISQNKSSFIANLSNELRTPMHSIIGFSQALLDGLGGALNTKQEKYVSIISKNANSLLALLNSILDISKIEAGKMEFNFKGFDVIHLINSVVETVNPLIKEKKLDFSTDLSDIIKRNIVSDDNMLRQVLLNIFTNAIKFTDIGSISLKVVHPDLEYVRYLGFEIPPEYTDKSYMLFSVSDTGIGISEDELNIIFDEYRQIDRSASKKYGGTGLGLAITRKIVNELDGIIWAESEPSQGSTFSFVIPTERLKK